jgi:hypothetical protein
MKIEFPKYHLAFNNLTTDDEGRLFLGTYEKNEDGEAYFYDIFDAMGRYVAKVPLRIKPMVHRIVPLLWRKNKLYTIEEDEEGFHMVKKYGAIWKGFK